MTTQYDSSVMINMMYASTLSVCITTLSGKILIMINTLIEAICTAIILIFDKTYNRKKCTITLTGTINFSTHTSIFPKEYYAILNELPKNIFPNTTITNMLNNENNFYINKYFKTTIPSYPITIEFYKPDNNGEQKIIISSFVLKRNELLLQIENIINKRHSITIINNINGDLSGDYCGIMYHIFSTNNNIPNMAYCDDVCFDDAHNFYSDKNSTNANNVHTLYINAHTMFKCDDIDIQFLDPIKKNIDKPLKESLKESSKEQSKESSKEQSKEQLKEQLKTQSNLLIQTIILSSTKSSHYIREKILEWYTQYKKAIESTNIITIVASISSKDWLNAVPIEYQACLHMLSKNVKNLRKINYNYVDNSNTCTYNENNTNYCVHSKLMIEIQPDIFVKFQNKMEKMYEFEIKKSILFIASAKYTTFELRDNVTSWVKIYKKFIKTSSIVEQKYYLNLILVEKIVQEFENNNKINKKIKELQWNMSLFTTYKTFDNIFFNDKKILLAKLNHFINNEDWYKKKGIPYNIGLLFHGTPGCGKTSCIKAISNYTNRHVVEIDLSKIKTCSEFINSFNREYFHNNYIPHQSKIIILEDIDCMIDIVKSRDITTDIVANKSSETTSDTVEVIDENSSITELKPEETSDKLTLSCILNTLDGVLENQHRILIITTNYVDRLDSALIRPGRIDMKVHFTKCTVEMIKDIIENYYEIKLNNNLPFNQIDGAFSPAEILDLCGLHNDNIQTMMEILFDQPLDDVVLNNATTSSDVTLKKNNKRNRKQSLKNN